MLYVIYNLVLLLAFPIIIVLLLTKKRCQRGVLSRLGAVPEQLEMLRPPVIWIHAASLGEVTAIVPLLRQMKERYPHCSLLVSTVTETGREQVMMQLEGIASHCYAPIDIWWAVERYVRTLRPQLFILVEAEFWPNLLKSLQRHHVPICLVNGRVSSRSFSRYVWIKGFMAQVLSCLDMALMQSRVDAERMRTLGANSQSVYVTGNMKFDQTIEKTDSRYSNEALRMALGLNSEEVVLVAGSTHPKEEECLLRAYRDLVQSHPKIVLIMAPRHVERALALEAVIQQHQLTCVRRSQLTSMAAEKNGARVILLDSRGELPYVYRLGFLGFVGGTLVPIGGHNLLEPAHWAKPVLFGPYIDHCREMAQLLLEEGGAIQIHNQADLLSHMIHLLDHPIESEQMGQRAFAVVQQHRGVTARNLQWIDQLLGGQQSPSASHVMNRSSQVESKEFSTEGSHS